MLPSFVQIFYSHLPFKPPILNGRPDGGREGHPVGERHDPALDEPREEAEGDEEREQGLLHHDLVEEVERILGVQLLEPLLRHLCTDPWPLGFRSKPLL